jgi:head-tail adaptor
MRRPPIGARRRRFVLELPQESPDGFGGVVRAFAAGPELWGAIETTGEGARDGPTHRVTLRWRAGVTPAMRLACGPRRFAIRACDDPDGRRRDLVCLVRELVQEAP